MAVQGLEEKLMELKKMLGAPHPQIAQGPAEWGSGRGDDDDDDDYDGDKNCFTSFLKSSFPSTEFLKQLDGLSDRHTGGGSGSGGGGTGGGSGSGANYAKITVYFNKLETKEKFEMLKWKLIDVLTFLGGWNCREKKRKRNRKRKRRKRKRR